MKNSLRENFALEDKIKKVVSPVLGDDMEEVNEAEKEKEEYLKVPKTPENRENNPKRTEAQKKMMLSEALFEDFEDEHLGTSSDKDEELLSEEQYYQLTSDLYDAVRPVINKYIRKGLTYKELGYAFEEIHDHMFHDDEFNFKDLNK